MRIEEDTPAQLEVLRGRVERNRNLKSSAGISVEAPQERLLDSVFGTTIARSEFLVPPEDITHLQETIDNARSLIFTCGKPYTEHPKYQDLNRVFMTPEKEENYRNNYWYIIGEPQMLVLGQLPEKFNIVPGFTAGSEMRHFLVPYEIHADKTKLKSDQDEEEAIGARLRIEAIDGRNKVYINIGFDDTFVLEIDFFDDEKWDKSKAAYDLASDLAYSADFPLASMTQEEYQIVNHYIQRFIVHVTDSSRNTS